MDNQWTKYYGRL